MHQLPHQHAGKQAGVDVAAADHQANLAAGEARRVGEQGGEAGSAGAFGDYLLDIRQQCDAAFDGRLFHPHQLGDVFADDL